MATIRTALASNTRNRFMITAHLPSGYCLAQSFANNAPLLLPAALLGAVLPDIDMIFFHFVDEGAVHHHRYWTHVPAFWLAMAAVTLPILRSSRYLPACVAFLAAISLHLVLDSIAGGIMWLYPFNERLFEVVTVPPTRSHWIWSFVFHWTFGMEIAIWLLALVLWKSKRRIR